MLSLLPPRSLVGDAISLHARHLSGRARDPRLGNAIEWVLSLQDDRGRWCNRHAYNTRTWGEVEHQGAPSNGSRCVRAPSSNARPDG